MVFNEIADNFLCSKVENTKYLLTFILAVSVGNFLPNLI